MTPTLPEAPAKKAVKASSRGPGPAPPSPGSRLCAPESVAFQALNEKDGTTVCSVFCLPEGRCQGLAQMGKLNYLGITSEGNCRWAGYTEASEVRNATLNWVMSVNGPCKGMTMSSFVKPGQQPAKKQQRTLPSFEPSEPICSGKMTAYEAIHPQHPNTCGVYCVPEGPCEGMVQSGTLKLGITAEGNCRKKGFTKSSTDYGAMGENVIDALKGFHGPCAGMTYAKFEKPV